MRDMQGMGGMPGGMAFDFGGGMPGGGKGTPPAAPIPQYAMSKGTQVVVRDLAKAQEHNGKRGTIAGWDGSSSRYQVELGDGQTLSLRPGNLTQACSVEVYGIESQPEMNGQAGTIFNYQAEPQRRYMVRMETKMSNGRDVVGLSPSNCILRVGTRVVVQGLTNEQFNGQMGQIKEVDRSAMRYTVECQNGKTVKIKLDNVLC